MLATLKKNKIQNFQNIKEKEQSSGSSKNIDSNEDSNKQDDEEEEQNQQQESKPKPYQIQTEQQKQKDSQNSVKHKLSKFEKISKGLEKDTESTRTDLSNIRADMIIIGKVVNDLSASSTTFVMDEIARIQKEFEKYNEIEIEEKNYLKQQVHYLTQDKIKLQQNELILTHRVEKTEHELGINMNLDSSY